MKLTDASAAWRCIVVRMKGNLQPLTIVETPLLEEMLDFHDKAVKALEFYRINVAVHYNVYGYEDSERCSCLACGDAGGHAKDTLAVLDEEV